MWSRIWTTWPENPHCGNCGVPFMNSTTSFDFTSLSMNCSMLISSSFWAGDAPTRAIRRLTPAAPATPIYVPQTIVHPKQIGARLACCGAFPAVETAAGSPRQYPPLVISISPLEAFFPKRNPYLGQAVLREPPLEANVLLLRPGVPQ